jgi:hypothetical protein
MRNENAKVYALTENDKESGTGGIPQAQQGLAQGGHGAGIVFILVVGGVERIAVRTAAHTPLDSKLAAMLQDSPEFPNETIVGTERHTPPLTRPDSRTVCDTLILWTNDPLAR